MERKSGLSRGGFSVNIDQKFPMVFKNGSKVIITHQKASAPPPLRIVGLRRELTFPFQFQNNARPLKFH